MLRRAILTAPVLVFLLSASSPALTPMEELGRQLFFDKISRPAQMMSCATCHGAEVGWTGPIPGINLHGGIYRGAVPTRFGNRKPPSSAYATQSPVFHYDTIAEEFVGGSFWDGRATGELLGSPAADQALGPFLSPVEQNMPDIRSVCETVAASPYAALFEEVWGAGSLDCSDAGVELTYDRIALSIAEYEASTEVNAFSSKYDLYWADCLAAGNDPEACGLAEGSKAVLDPNGVLSDLEWDGLIEFGEYCAPCHVSHVMGPGGSPPLFTDFTFENIGVPRNPENPFYDMDTVFLDDGSPINPEGDAFVDRGLGDFLRTRPEWAALAPANDGKFKVPTVRNVDKRRGFGFPKAYMHNGVFKTLAEVVHFYNTRDVPEEMWPPPEVEENVNRDLLEGVPLGNLELDQHAEDAIVAFLKTLNDGFRPGRSSTRLGPRHEIAPADPDAVRVGLGREIHFAMRGSGVVGMKVYDVRGREVRRFGPMSLGPGSHTVRWDGRDNHGGTVPSGVYFLRMKTPDLTETIKLTVVR